MNMVITATPEVLDNYSPAPVKVPENQELYEKLGFTLQKETRTSDLLEGLGIKPLSQAEIIEWTNFLPTQYKYTYHQEGFRRIHNRKYTYDLPPIEVVNLIDYCIESKMFDKLVIRTPETIGLKERKREIDRLKERKREIEWMKDPALFGIVDGKVYLLAKWAESRLLPRWLRRIAANINNVRSTGGYISFLIFLFLVGIFGVLCLNWTFADWGPDANGNLVGSIAALVISSILFFVGLFPVSLLSGVILYDNRAGDEMS